MPIRKKGITAEESKAAMEAQAPLPVSSGTVSKIEPTPVQNHNKLVVLGDPAATDVELVELENEAVSLEEGGYESFLPTVTPESLAKSRQPFFLTNAKLREGADAMKFGPAVIFDCIFGKGAHPGLKGREFSLIMSLNEGRRKLAAKMNQTQKNVGPNILTLLPTTKGNPFSQLTPWDGTASTIIDLDMAAPEEDGGNGNGQVPF